jgi:hypothetical protein
MCYTYDLRWGLLLPARLSRVSHRTAWHFKNMVISVSPVMLEHRVTPSLLPHASLCRLPILLAWSIVEPEHRMVVGRAWQEIRPLARAEKRGWPPRRTWSLKTWVGFHGPSLPALALPGWRRGLQVVSGGRLPDKMGERRIELLDKIEQAEGIIDFFNLFLLPRNYRGSSPARAGRCARALFLAILGPLPLSSNVLWCKGHDHERVRQRQARTLDPPGLPHQREEGAS